MKIIHLSDCHFIDPTPKGAAATSKAHPQHTLQNVIADINKWQSDAELCIISGDLTHDGTALQYGLFASTINALPMPVHVIPGNHDARAALLAGLPATGCDENGFINYAFTHKGIRFVFLDTLIEGEDAGVLCEKRLAWLTRELATSQNLPVLIFMHHPPVAVGLPFMDSINLQNAAEFGDVISMHGNVKHIFFGHLHRPCHGIWRNIPWTCGPSSYTGQPLAMQPGTGLPDKAWLEPGYGIALINENDASVCYHVETVPNPKI
ncbi:phosphodiesterase [Thalassospira marina]|uniref:Phosphodiesterase n=1 Tax=Thalassospira marina TaxID=2048283 RepID=A0A2N3KWM3_9PROT|nr:phosphodiesterase [Thalassospira marina]PKR54886.1 phosphodiesterase [Thalassospira marina]